MIDPPRPMPEPHHAQPCDLELLALFSAGELDAAQRELVSAHLVDCDRCWDELRAQRGAVDAVQQLWEPAPVGVRADIRAAINGDTQPRPRRDLRRRILLVAAAVVVAISAGGVVVNRLSFTTHDRQVTAAASLPASVRAAITQSGHEPPRDSGVPPAPTLSGAGFRLAASGSANAGGIAAAQYTYADRTGHRVTVFVAARGWPRPQPAVAVSARAWLIAPATPASVTIVGGSDQAGDNMLVIASDHTAAMTAAAELGLV